MALKVGTWAAVESDCAIDYILCGDDSIEIHFGGADGFDFDMDPDAARRLADVVARALTELDDKRADRLNCPDPSQRSTRHH
jgi:hypothetical protein